MPPSLEKLRAQAQLKPQYGRFRLSRPPSQKIMNIKIMKLWNYKKIMNRFLEESLATE